ncbi:alpha/beta fold hydrolase [Actinomarinicola tropica]|uniref:Alpha/beta fold hydrolase n=1 Tax=Actinomarinicola tropica TaxID=2789776 RepID=A0A5Q2RI90_9ACTN|nr:alpha/beta fold hydrolase [Actinomarinicola tropica]QGG95523.1 alpha/beta fold hydrolase [Actinomarinicola tropica]
MTALHADRRGTGPRLALVHGFTQTRRCWGPIAEDLAADHELVLLDAPGHGRSADVALDLVDGGRALADTAGPATFVGYSMGGRFALHAALERPAQVRALVLVGATAGIESADERAQRREDDEARARRIEEIGVDRFLDEWLALPLFAGLSPEAACREERRENTAAGLASSLRLAGTGTQLPSWHRLGELSMPVLVVAGADDEKFLTLGTRLAEAVGGDVEIAAIEGAGHTAHLEQPGRFLAVLRPWLAARGL